MKEAQSKWGKHLQATGKITVQAILLPATRERFDAVIAQRGLNKRSDGLKEAIADYLQKHEKAPQRFDGRGDAFSLPT